MPPACERTGSAWRNWGPWMDGGARVSPATSGPRRDDAALGAANKAASQNLSVRKPVGFDDQVRHRCSPCLALACWSAQRRTPTQLSRCQSLKSRARLFLLFDAWWQETELRSAWLEPSTPLRAVGSNQQSQRRPQPTRQPHWGRGNTVRSRAERKGKTSRLGTLWLQALAIAGWRGSGSPCNARSSGGTR